MLEFGRIFEAKTPTVRFRSYDVVALSLGTPKQRPGGRGAMSRSNCKSCACLVLLAPLRDKR